MDVVVAVGDAVPGQPLVHCNKQGLNVIVLELIVLDLPIGVDNPVLVPVAEDPLIILRVVLVLYVVDVQVQVKLRGVLHINILNNLQPNNSVVVADLCIEVLVDAFLELALQLAILYHVGQDGVQGGLDPLYIAFV